MKEFAWKYGKIELTGYPPDYNEYQLGISFNHWNNEYFIHLGFWFYSFDLTYYDNN